MPDAGSRGSSPCAHTPTLSPDLLHCFSPACKQEPPSFHIWKIFLQRKRTLPENMLIFRAGLGWKGRIPGVRLIPQEFHTCPQERLFPTIACPPLWEHSRGGRPGGSGTGDCLFCSAVSAFIEDVLVQKLGRGISQPQQARASDVANTESM